LKAGFNDDDKAWDFDRDGKRIREINIANPKPSLGVRPFVDVVLDDSNIYRLLEKVCRVLSDCKDNLTSNALNLSELQEEANLAFTEIVQRLKEGDMPWDAYSSRVSFLRC